MIPVFRVRPSERTLIIPEHVNPPDTDTAPADDESPTYIQGCTD